MWNTQQFYIELHLRKQEALGSHKKFVNTYLF